jgi:type IV pilus assembly protein PilY1
MKPSPLFKLSQATLAVAGVFGVACPANTANTDIANEPLSQAATGVKPNVMFILDASGSMDWDYSPDYIDDVQPSGATPNTTAACFDSGDTGPTTTAFSEDFDDAAGSIAGRPNHCIPGDPPYMSPDFNKQYYNPAISYRPGVNSDGTDMTNMTGPNTANWTQVPTDPYKQQEKDTLGKGMSTADIVAGYPDRAWCKNDTDAATNTTNCRVNSAYTYPNWEFTRGLTGTASYGGNFANVKYRLGGPYYYRMQTAQWCSTSSGAVGTCVSGSSADPAVHKFVFPEFCTDAELIDCAAGAALTAAHVFSGARFCSDAGTLANCQRKKVGNFRWPKHLGAVKTLAAPLGGAAATGTIIVTSVSSGLQFGLTIGGASPISGLITASDNNPNTLASQIRNAINSHVSSPDYTATVSGATVTINAAVQGVAANGKTIVKSTSMTGTAQATATITVNSSGNGNDVFVDAIRVDHPTLGVINIMNTACSGGYGSNVSVIAGGTFGNRIRADTGTDQSGERNAMADGIRDCISETSGSHGFTASRSGNIVTVRAPLALGDTINGRTITVVKGTAEGSFATTTFSGGASVRISTTGSASMSGGIDPIPAGATVRVGVGYFSRVNIDPSDNTYDKAPGRIDCVGSVCTYAEEMTNFANWYAYYRTRMQMMKSASGRAFIPINDTYRVGFITIKPFSDPNDNSGSVVSERYLKIADFDMNHKEDWYKKFYEQKTGGGTPLREALSRVGRLYAGQFDGINDGIPKQDDPVQVSCQPNFAILSTDGYWNGNNGDQVDSSGMTQQDHNNTGPYSLRADGVYDGGASTTSGLADTALYYYMNDLRGAGATNADTGVDVSANNVPTTQNDFAAHQHMTTFTLGLGLDGELSFRSDYQIANSGDFWRIKQGTLNWPDPKNDSPSALDDLWHAAVNGRGVFFSASNPHELSNSLSDTLDALKKRVGAGAAAATSNLQPVAGDNLAFTAQYQTSDWVGDVKARTIDLSTGAISFVELWSAQSLLNAGVHTDRKIFTFDASDPYVSTSTGAVGNQLKHFCMSAAPISPWCNDGGGLTVAEQAFFKSNQLPQSVSYNAVQIPNATAENLVNYLRGHQDYEDQGTIAATDLFRSRSALLGDIISAQPSYVKASPFNYNDTGYQDFKKCTSGTTTVSCPAAQFPAPTQARRGTVYVAANDGMLHAFETDVNNSPYYQTGGIGTATTSDDTFSGGNNTGNGAERWAFIPGIVLPDMYKLASIPYSHRYYVDGSPTVGDICLSTPCAGLGDWRTILVGGLNAGGRGFYALDVTNPTSPRALWEFKVRKPSVTACAATPALAVGATDDCDLGLSYGNPIITKLKATGRWVVIFTSGLNNTGVEPATTNRQGDGGGYLYVLDAVSGRILHKIPTSVGSPGTAALSYADADPSGLARIINWVDDSLTDNTTLAVYGGDMKGNLWRFDLDPSSATYLNAVKLAELKDGATPQPITTKPELGLISNRRVVFLGTGRFLGVSDKSDLTQQAIYAIADDQANHVLLADKTGLVQQTMVDSGGTTRSMPVVQPVDWSCPTPPCSTKGWYMNFPPAGSGERVNVDPQLQLGTLVITSNVPLSDTCVAGGIAWVNTFDFKTGGYVAGVNAYAVSQKISGSVAVGINVIMLPGGKVVTVVTTADNQQLPVDTPIAPSNFQGRRVGWRELNSDH